MTELSATVLDQRRDAGWAASQEQRLRKSFASSDAARSGLTLRQLICKTSLCELSFDAGDAASPPRSPPAATASPFAAVDQWLAWHQPCGYTLSIDPTRDPVDPTALRAFLQCSQ